MSTELARLEDFDFETANYEELAALTGQSFGGGEFTERHFSGATINTKRKLKDKPVPNPAYKLFVDGSITFLTDDIKFIFLGKNYIFRVYDSVADEYTVQTVIAPEYRNRDLMDTSGGFNAGNMGYLPPEVYEGLTKDQQDAHKAAKRSLVVHGLIKGNGKTIDGEEVELDEWVPVKMYISRSVAGAYEDVFKSFHKSRTPSFTKEVDVTSLDIEQAGSFDVGVPTFAINMESSVDIASVGPHIKEMVSDINDHNDFVEAEHMSAHKSKDTAAQDAKFIEVLNEGED